MRFWPLFLAAIAVLIVPAIWTVLRRARKPLGTSPLSPAQLLRRPPAFNSEAGEDIQSLVPSPQWSAVDSGSGLPSWWRSSSGSHSFLIGARTTLGSDRGLQGECTRGEHAARPHSSAETSSCYVFALL